MLFFLVFLTTTFTLVGEAPLIIIYGNDPSLISNSGVVKGFIKLTTGLNLLDDFLDEVLNLSSAARDSL